MSVYSDNPKTEAIQLWLDRCMELNAGGHMDIFRLADPLCEQDKIAACIRETGHHPVILSPALYDAAKVLGYDMRHYVKQQPLPSLPASPARPSPAPP